MYVTFSRSPPSKVVGIHKHFYTDACTHRRFYTCLPSKCPIMLGNPLRDRRFRSIIGDSHHMSTIKMSYYASEPTSRPTVPQHNKTLSPHVYDQNLLFCLGKPQFFPQFLTIEPHSVCQGRSRSRQLKITIFPQVLTIEFHFVRKGGSRGATQNRTFSSVLGDRTSYRARLSRFVIVRGHRPRLNS